MEDKIVEILYKNSHDTSEGLVIKFKDIEKIVQLLIEVK